MYDSIVNAISNFTLKISGFFEPIINVVWYIISIFKTIWFWLTSLLTEIADLIDDVFVEWDFFHNIWQTFGTLWQYIWFPWVLLLSTLLLITMLRILIAFVFKIFRLNIDYKMRETNRKKTHNREPSDYVEDETYPRLPS